MKPNLLLAMISSVMLVACSGGEAGKEFNGKWVHTKIQSRTLEIRREGSEFVIHEEGPSPLGGKRVSSDTAAKLDGDVLVVQTGVGLQRITLNRESGILTNGLAEYKRAD